MKALDLFSRSQHKTQKGKIKTPKGIKGNMIPMIPCFPDDITEIILLGVPVDRLVEFKCVAKSWCALISSKRFVKIHLNNTNKDTSFGHQMLITGKFWKSQYIVIQYSLRSFVRNSSIDAFDLPQPRWTIDVKKQVFFIGCINGLCCINIDSNDYFIWNPCLRKYKKLPDLDCEIRKLTRYGFGYDESNDDYKFLVTYTIFGFNPVWDEHRFSIKCASLYSLKRNSWKRTEHFDVGGMDRQVIGQFLNGRLHWLVHGRNLESSFVYFDVGSELHGTLELPSLNYSYCTLGVLDECLCLLHDDFSSKQTCLWIYAQYGVKESLVKLATIPHAGIPDWHGPCLINTPLCILPGGEILLLNGTEFISYDPRRGYITRVQPNNNSQNPNSLVYRAKGFLYACIYVKSLVSPFTYDEPSELQR